MTTEQNTFIIQQSLSRQNTEEKLRNRPQRQLRLDGGQEKKPAEKRGRPTLQG